MANKLSEGVVGKKLIDYFAQTTNSVLVEAEYLGHVSTDEVNYRMTFDDGSVSDWKVTFAPVNEFAYTDPEWDYAKSYVVESADCFNEVL